MDSQRYRSPFGFGTIYRMLAHWYIEDGFGGITHTSWQLDIYLDQMLAWDCLLLA